MSQRFLLPCECGQTLVIQIGQAGQDIACVCGRTVTVPGMREIRRLQVADQDSAAQSDRHAAAAGFSPARVVFSLGVAIAFLGLAFAGFMLVQRAQLDLGLSEVEQRKYEDDIIESFSADLALDAWRELRHAGLGSQDPSASLISRKLYNEAGSAIQQALIVTAIAGVLAAIAAVVDRKAAK